MGDEEPASDDPARPTQATPGRRRNERPRCAPDTRSSDHQPGGTRRDHHEAHASNVSATARGLRRLTRPRSGALETDLAAANAKVRGFEREAAHASSVRWRREPRPPGLLRGSTREIMTAHGGARGSLLRSATVIPTLRAVPVTTTRRGVRGGAVRKLTTERNNERGCFRYRPGRTAHAPANRGRHGQEPNPASRLRSCPRRSRYGQQTDIITFNDLPRAQFVEER